VTDQGTDIARAAGVLRRGGLVAFPTETVYGLGADAASAAAVARVFDVKGRPRAHPLIVHLAAAAQLDAWADAPGDDARALAAAFWPGPLTLIARRAAHVLDDVTGGARTVGLRVPSHPVARALLEVFGGGIAAPSANRFGAVSPTTAQHVAADLGDDVDYILDGGACEVGVESTIVDVSGGAPALLRPGGVTREQLEAALGRPLATPTPASAPAPGTLPSHYATRARVVAVAAAALAAAVADAIGAAGPTRVAVLAPAAALAVHRFPDGVALAALPDAPAAMAHALYGALRALDAPGIAIIVAALPPETGLGAAVADRLRRAAGPRQDHEDEP
jgi:L-threonylcarbamoyladenylate synthase